MHHEDCDLTLDELHPDARIAVMTDVPRHEAEFTTGAALRQQWESPRVDRVHQVPTPPSVESNNPWRRVRCPDYSYCFIRFLSEKYRLLQGDTTPSRNGETMPDKTKKTPPPRKTSAAAKTTKPVAAPKSSAAKAPSTPRKPKTEGNYKWLLNRLKAQATSSLSTDANRSTIREGLKNANTFKEVRSFFERAEVGADKFDAFLDEFFNAAINR